MPGTMEFPHLKDQESVRAEAAEQYGGLDNAAAFVQAQKASRDPNVEAAALRRIDPEETEKVKDDLSLAQAKIDAEYGKDSYTVLDAAVRGDALSVVAEAPDGRTYHLVTGWTKNYKPVVTTAAQRAERVGQAAEAAKGRLGSEARAEVERLVKEATDKALERVADLLKDKGEEVDKIRAKAVKEAYGDEKPKTPRGKSSEPKPKATGSQPGKGGNPASRGNEASDEGQPAKGPSSEV